MVQLDKLYALDTCRPLPCRNMPRIHLFELHEQHWMPSIVRGSVVECLSHMFRWRRIANGLIGPFQEFLHRSGATRVLDLCSGAGGPAFALAEQLRKQEAEPPRIVLTDLFPQVEPWEAARRELAVDIDYCTQPVNATQVTPELSTGSVRMINNAFHHFRPEVARAILEDAMHNSAGIFISELYPRGLPSFFQFGASTQWIVFFSRGSIISS